MAFPLFIALGVASLPIGAVAIAKAIQKKNDSDYTEAGGLIVPVYRYPQQQKANLINALAIAAAGYYLAKKAKLI